MYYYLSQFQTAQAKMVSEPEKANHRPSSLNFFNFIDLSYLGLGGSEGMLYKRTYYKPD